METVRGWWRMPRGATGETEMGPPHRGQRRVGGSFAGDTICQGSAPSSARRRSVRSFRYRFAIQP
jgi:hypothetical protein